MSAPARQVLEKALGAACFRVERLPRGARKITYIGEHTARNTEVDALDLLQGLAHRAGLDAGVEVSGRGAILTINPEDDAEARRLDEHPHGCGCRDCDPDFYFDPAEREAGRGDKTCGADDERSSVGPAPFGAMARR